MSTWDSKQRPPGHYSICLFCYRGCKHKESENNQLNISHTEACCTVELKIVRQLLVAYVYCSTITDLAATVHLRPRPINSNQRHTTFKAKSPNAWQRRTGGITGAVHSVGSKVNQGTSIRALPAPMFVYGSTHNKEIGVIKDLIQVIQGIFNTTKTCQSCSENLLLLRLSLV